MESDVNVNRPRKFHPDDIQKLFRIELKQAKRKSLLYGMLLGVLLFCLTIAGFASMLWLNKEAVAEKALDYVISGYLTDLFESFPDAYVSYNQHKILPILDKFTNAAAKKYVSEAEFKEIGKSLIFALKDKELTYHEIDEILSQMKRASSAGAYFD
ncbi:hypothetical protein IIA28_11920 [candidate division KSB1 bacterium]|nr:hypothetical protein [candidate division KSB1 bacterium]